ncbi:hypothetical protein [Hydrogenophaga sp. 5NK40-0174]|uniref:hypothetical protein n=1 Tax=Hydrogenophaga sp. 5NK40-0174 TaxID=3127649 RepID=UPI00310C3667
MKPDQIFLITAQGWFDLSNGQCRPVEPWSETRGTAMAVVDFADSQTGVQPSQGKAEYASALIEKSVRDEGSVEGPLQVFVHAQEKLADSTQTFYTAVPLDQWQEIEAWSGRQEDHCLVVPVAALLDSNTLPEHVQVLRVGGQLHAFTRDEGRMLYANAMALGQDEHDLQAQLRNLISQLKAAGWKGNAIGFRWGCALTDSLDRERTLLGLGDKSQGGDLNARLLPHESLRNTAGNTVSSALPSLLENIKTQALAASTPARLAWLSERYVVPLAATIGVVALGLAGFAMLSQQSISSERQAAQSLQGEIEQLRERANRAASLNANASLDNQPVEFARQLGYAAIYDPVRMLGSVRQAAGRSIRIQRLQLFKANHLSKPQFRVDGVVAGGSNQELSRFLGALRSHGWSAESIAPNDSSIGAFAYILQPLPANGQQGS